MNSKKRCNVFRVFSLAVICSCMLAATALADVATADAMKTEPQTYSVEAEKTGIIIPVSFSKAGVYEYDIAITGFAGKADKMFIVNHGDSSSIKVVQSFVNGSLSNNIVVESAGILDFCVISENAPINPKSVTMSFKYHEPVTEGREIKSGEEVTSSALQDVYYSFNLKNDSLVTLTGQVGLYDSKKRFLNHTSTKTESDEVYLEKGKYYLKASKGLWIFKYTAKKAKLSPNINDKNKSETLNLGKSNKIILPANAKGSTVYYKLTLSSPKKINVSYKKTDMKLSSEIDVKLYKNSVGKRAFATGKMSDKNKKSGKIYLENKKNAGHSSIKLDAGTWIFAVTGKDGGTVSIKFK